MGRSEQRKGRAGEIELSRILQDNGIDATAAAPLNYGTIPDIIGIPGIHAEVKRVERLNIHEAMTQAMRDAERFKDGSPAVFHRKNRMGWLVTMPLHEWLKLYKGELKG